MIAAVLLTCTDVCYFGSALAVPVAATGYISTPSGLFKFALAFTTSSDVRALPSFSTLVLAPLYFMWNFYAATRSTAKIRK